MNLKFNYAADKTKLEKLTNLTTLDLSYNNLTEEQLNLLQAVLTNCTIVNLDYKNRSLFDGARRIKEPGK
jgi:Leucine-rich repeat (LRR) protein